MKVRDWILEVEPETAHSGSCLLRLGLRDSKNQQTSELISSCRSLDEFQQEISRIKVELDEMQKQAREKLHALTEAQGQKGFDPENIWRKMESLPSEEEMFDYFNSFSVSDRHRIAEYILSRVNMFKGRGPVFSENYDAASHLLG